MTVERQSWRAIDSHLPKSKAPFARKERMSARSKVLLAIKERMPARSNPLLARKERMPAKQAILYLIVESTTRPQPRKALDEAQYWSSSYEMRRRKIRNLGEKICVERKTVE